MTQLPVALRQNVTLVRRPRIRIFRIVVFVLLAGLLAGLGYELYTSRLQAGIFSRIAREATYTSAPGASPFIRFPKTGPYNERAGYVQLPAFVRRLRERGYRVASQARLSPRAASLIDEGFFPIYPEKSQMGLRILDQGGTEIFNGAYPQRVYTSFRDIPPLVTASLLFIENRELLDPGPPTRNPAIEWDRLAKAGFDYMVNKVNPNWRVTGGSTLATQIEKFRHSPGGRTSSPRDKVMQMISASLRAYHKGEFTVDARRQIVLDYMNSIPLSAVPGYGEVSGLGDALWFWYGADFDSVNALLFLPQNEALEHDPYAWAKTYRQVLSLFIAQRAPSTYLLSGPEALAKQTDEYIRMMADEGVFTPVVARLLLTTQVTPKRQAPRPEPYSFTERKAINAVRTHLMSQLGVERLYELDRMDVSVVSSLDRNVQERIVEVLGRLDEPAYAASAGLLGHRLLGSNDLNKVIYSFTLYERGEEANWLRIQADNLDQPLDINQGAKLELGSTAKLRTLVSYLEVISFLHGQYAGWSPEELRTATAPPSDHLTRWAFQYLASASDTSLSAMLDAALNRVYSTSPKEKFFTGGGLHVFSNFDNKQFGGALTVRDAFHNSVNLVFIRMMRDIVHYYMFRVPGSTALLMEGGPDSLRQVYLEKFADREGNTFLRRFFNKYEGKSSQEALELLLSGRQITPLRLTVIFRTLNPEAGSEALAEFIRGELPNAEIGDRTIRDLYDRYGPESFSLADRGYLARIHPLELWTLWFLRQQPQAGLKQVIEASRAERLAVYDWLFKTRHKNAQDSRIRTMLEVEAFLEVHRSWKRLGYPFESLVPSYATSIGSSADRPAALAELVGVLLNDGVRQPTLRLSELHFAAGTPYETLLKSVPAKGERVLLPEVAAAAREAMAGVVEKGTAQRIRNTFTDTDGQQIRVGGKTGTGDNRFTITRKQEKANESLVINRTATFVFYIGDRFYGTITTYVPGEAAAAYHFTSGLAVQLLKHLAPDLIPLIGSVPAKTAGAEERKKRSV
ncbi:MAG: transglycosylase domain-containing protein [candidate division Zixibacteria bacterium]|nr:transglycosylase domain-containing protein [candidate division Zixibacteria bacterium]